MEEKLLNNIQARIDAFNEEYGLNLELDLMGLKENENMFHVSGDLYNLNQEQGNKLENLFVDLGIHYSMNRGGIYDDINEIPTYWLFIINEKDNENE